MTGLVRGGGGVGSGAQAGSLLALHCPAAVGVLCRKGFRATDKADFVASMAFRSLFFLDDDETMEESSSSSAYRIAGWWPCTSATASHSILSLRPLANIFKLFFAFLIFFLPKCFRTFLAWPSASWMQSA